jgi:molybdopterin biosynthesis enzyme MoaB
LKTGGTGISPDDITPEVCVLVLFLFNKLIFALGDELSYFKENFWSSTNNDCEFISNYSHDYAFQLKFILSFLSRPICGIYQQTLIINLPGSSKVRIKYYSVLHEPSYISYIQFYDMQQI